MVSKIDRHALQAMVDEIQAKADAEREADPEAWARREAAEAAAEQARQFEQQINERRSHYGTVHIRMPDHVVEAYANGTLRQTLAMEAVTKWAEAKATPWLILSGGNGCGKTVAAATHVASRRHSPMWDYNRWKDSAWIRSDDIVRTFSGHFGEAREEQLRLRDAGLLGIDELGTETDNARMLPALLELLDYRCSARNTPTVCTTNLTKVELVERYGKNGRLVSRLNELATFVTCEGTDLRKRKK